MNIKRKLIMNRIYLSGLFLLALFTSNLLQAQCIIDGLIVDATVCNDINEFDVVLDFEWGGGTDSVVIAGNGNNYGTFAKADMPVTIDSPFFIGDNSTVYEFVVYDTDLMADCSADIDFGPLGCGPMQLCEITELSIEAIECGTQDIQTLVIDFEHSNATNDYFDITDTESNILATFLLSDLPVTWDYNYSNITLIETLFVCINDTPDCCAGADFMLLDCPPNGCAVNNLELIFGDCDDIDHFDVWIDFDYQNTADSFDLSFTPGFAALQSYAYVDLPILVGNFSNVSFQTFSATVFDQDDPDCVASTTASYFCNNNCEIVEMDVQTSDCDPNGFFVLAIDFEVENPSDDFFDLFIDQEFIGFFPLSDLPLEYDYSSMNASGLVQVCINDNADCCAQMEFENPCSTGCEIWNITAEPTPCNDLGLFNAVINFNHANTNSTFTIVGNGNNYGTFSYTDLPVTLTDLEANGTVYEFIVTDTDQPDCSNFTGLEVNCGTDCQFTDFIVEAWDCDADGAFLIDIDFNVENPISDSFHLLISTPSTTVLETYAYSDLWLTTGPLYADGSTYLFSVWDVADESCSTGGTLVSEDCVGTDCLLWDLTVEPTDCDSDGNFYTYIDFDAINANDSFHITIASGNSVYEGTHIYGELPLTAGPLVGDGSVYTMQIIDNEDETCALNYNFDSEDCDAPSDCEISNLDVYPLTCNPDGSYSVLVLFDYENVNSDHFDVFAENGDLIGTYNYDELPLTISSFPTTGNSNDVLSVCNNDNDQCCAIAEFEALDCSTCEIVNVLLEEQACDVDLNFMVSLDLEVQGNGALGFLVLGNGTNYGAFDYADLPIELGPFTGDAITTYEFIVVDIANTSCTGTASIGPIDCQTPQPIWPGDINLDFISNHFDLLNIGVAYGETGAERTVSDIDWMSFEGEDWAGAFLNGVNWKHADCNGDGEINNIDITAIENNYDETHGTVLPYQEIDIEPGSPLFFIDLPDFDEVTLGEAFVAPIILGDQDTPVDQIYGIAFTVEYDPTMMDEAGVYVETGSSWLGEQNTQLVSIDKSFADEGIIEVAITRTDHQDAAGFGTISYFIGIIDDIAGKSEVTVDITNVVAITYEEARIGLETPTSTIDLATGLEETLDKSVTVFPNPAQETLNVYTSGIELPTQIMVYNTLGQLVKQIDSPTDQLQLNVNNWNSGVYFLDIQFEQGTVNRKIEILK